MGKSNVRKKRYMFVRNLMFLFICGGFCKIAIPTLWNGSLSTIWPRTEGVVLEKFLSPRNVNSGVLWKPVIRYQYRVNRRLYHGTRISFSIFIFGKQWASAHLEKYAQNDKIIVFYNPRNPQISCIEAGPEKWAVLYSLIGLGGVVWAILSSYRLLSSKQTTDR